MILVDSDVLIWHTRGNAIARSRLATIDPWRISTITYLELAQGCRSNDELQRVKRGLQAKQTEVFPLTPAICERATALIEAHALSDGLRVADALIAATAIEHGLTLLSANTRHYRALAELMLESFEPHRIG